MAPKRTAPDGKRRLTRITYARGEGATEESAAPYDRAAYAVESRHACAPDECTEAEICWVKLGTTDSLRSGFQGTPRCITCLGKVRYERWRTPGGLGLPAHGRLLSRAKGHSRGAPDQRRQE